MVPLYYTKEVILLPTASENDVVRGGRRKQMLMENGFILIIGLKNKSLDALKKSFKQS